MKTYLLSALLIFTTCYSAPLSAQPVQAVQSYVAKGAGALTLSALFLNYARKNKPLSNEFVGATTVSIGSLIYGLYALGKAAYIKLNYH